jgi:small multidrug resistance family-3 protein
MLRIIAVKEDRQNGQQAKMNILFVDFARTFLLFIATAIAELVGCYLPLLWLSGKGSAWLLLPAAICLASFAWLLTLHPAASGRVYATYGAVYIASALVWLWVVDGIKPSVTDYLGVGLALVGAAVIAFGKRYI